MSAETSTGVVAAVLATSAAVVSTPGAADYAWLVFGALVGAMHSVSKVETPTRLSAIWYILKWVGTAGVLTFFVAEVVQFWFDFPAYRWPGVVAFGITFFADRWPEWVSALLEFKFKPRTPEKHDE